MKGLILKDLYTLKPLLKAVAFFFVFFGIIGFLGKDAAYLNSSSSIICVLLCSWGVNCFSYDEYYHWDRFSVTLPCSRACIVLARYLIFLLLALAGLVFSLAFSFGITLVLSLPFSWGEFIASALGSLFMGLFLVSVMGPFAYRVSADKLRYVIFVVVLVPTLLLLLLYQLLRGPALNAIADWANRNLALVGVGVAAFSVLLFLGSLALSIRIFSQKEY